MNDSTTPQPSRTSGVSSPLKAIIASAMLGLVASPGLPEEGNPGYSYLPKRDRPFNGKKEWAPKNLRRNRLGVSDQEHERKRALRVFHQHCLAVHKERAARPGLTYRTKNDSRAYRYADKLCNKYDDLKFGDLIHRVIFSPEENKRLAAEFERSRA